MRRFTGVLVSGAALLAALLGPAAPAAAATFRGVTFPDTVTIAGRECRLNGVGVRTRFVVKVYLGALYLATPARDAAAAVAADEPKRLVMHFVHSRLGADKIREAFVDGLRKNAGPSLGHLQARIDRLVSWVDEDARRGDEVVFTYVPGVGTEIAVKGKVRGTVEGADFMQALWSIWLGAAPADAGLKKAMLGLAKS